MAKINEDKLIITEIRENRAGEPFVLPSEVVLMLWNRGDLLSVYIKLLFLSRLKVRFTIKQPELAKIIGLGRVAFYQKRKELEQLKLITVKIENHNLTKVFIEASRVQAILSWGGSDENHKRVLWKPSELIVFEDCKQFQDYLVNTEQSLLAFFKSVDINESQLGLNINIYNNTSNTDSNNINVSNTNSDSNISINAKPVEKVEKYPHEDYAKVFDAFIEYKGVKPSGPEKSYHFRAIKMMFQANRKVNEIISFMKWLHDNERNREQNWVQYWTIWTVQKKIAEFVAGKFKDSFDDDFKEYGK